MGTAKRQHRNPLNAYTKCVKRRGHRRARGHDIVDQHERATLGYPSGALERTRHIAGPIGVRQSRLGRGGAGADEHLFGHRPIEPLGDSTCEQETLIETASPFTAGMQRDRKEDGMTSDAIPNAGREEVRKPRYKS